MESNCTYFGLKEVKLDDSLNLQIFHAVHDVNFCCCCYLIILTNAFNLKKHQISKKIDSEYLGLRLKPKRMSVILV